MPFPAYAHEGEEEELMEPPAGPSTHELEKTISQTTLGAIGLAYGFAILLVVVSLFLKEKSDRVKALLYAGIAIPIVLATLYLAGTTIYFNLISATGGPVHWHADYEVWACGEKLDLTDPQGFSNRIGSATFHEHNDDRIHVEGAVVDPKDVSLGKFFEFVGGELHEDHLSYATNEGVKEYNNGDQCPDGTAGTLQVFLYKTNEEEKTFHQEKLVDFPDYVISPEGVIPPGDCLIIEFGEEKEKTDKLCKFYESAVERGDLEEVKN